MRTHLSLALLSLCAVSIAQFSGSKPVPSDVKTGFDVIQLSNAKTWLEYLAGPECMGRGSLQPGYLKAAQYMADRFKEMGLKPMGDDGTYFQQVPFVTGTVLPGTGLTVGNTKIEIAEDILSLSGATKSEDLSASIAVVVASGADAKPENFDKLKGRIVFTMLDGVNREYRRALRDSGALATIEVTELITGRREFRSMGQKMRVLGRIHPAQFKKVAEELGMSSEGPGVRTYTKPATLTFKVDAQVQYSPNVVATMEGSDPVLKNEYVGFGSHLDHLGVVKDANGKEVVYWGADDDASGSTSLLLVAQAFAANPMKPKRSLVFMAFTAEEMGLIGSGFLADNPPFPIEKMICELQMDMVGRNAEGLQEGKPPAEDPAKNHDTIRLVGSQRIATGLHGLILEQNSHLNFQFRYDREDVYTRSDHYQFASRGVPVAFLFDGFHPDYHRPTDTVDKINYDKLMNSAKLFYLVGMRAANRDKPFDKDVPPSTGGGEGIGKAL